MGKVIRFKKPSWLIGLRYFATRRFHLPATLLPIMLVVVGVIGMLVSEYGRPLILASDHIEPVRVWGGSDGARSVVWRQQGNTDPAPTDLSCSSPRITDGDTFRCAGTRVRLVSIDAPEMPGHCREGRRCVDGDPYAARSYLRTLTRGRITCTILDRDHYGRAIARCQSARHDLSCEMFQAGYAEIRYGGHPCNG